MARGVDVDLPATVRDFYDAADDDVADLWGVAAVQGVHGD